MIYDRLTEVANSLAEAENTVLATEVIEIRDRFDALLNDINIAVQIDSCERVVDKIEEEASE